VRGYDRRMLALRIAVGGALAIAAVLLLSHWHGWLIGMSLFGVGFVLLLTRFKKNDPGPVGWTGILCALFGTTVLSASFVVPEVDGVVSERRLGKGSSYTLVVREGARPGDVIGNTDDAHCREGMRLVKPAWSTAYTCGGRPVSSGTIFIYPVLGLELAGCCALLAWMLGKAITRRSLGRSPAP
jgi:hypothetical protein